MSEIRRKHDTLGEVEVPEGALYGPQTARAVRNFPVSGWAMPSAFIRATGLIKLAVAESHKSGGRMDAALADAIIAAAGEVADGKLDEHFPVDVFQTGSATSTNMNANEVIAARAAELLGDGASVHPNDDVNRGQSSNDVIPTALHVAAAVEIHSRLIPAVEALRDSLSAQASEFDDMVKIGRTHLMDAVPVRLGQEFAGYAAQMDSALDELRRAVDALCEVPIGGTAVGTGLNAPDGFGADICRRLSEKTSLSFRECPNRFAAQSARDTAVQVSGTLRRTALAMGKVASDIRLLASGPRCGLGELTLPALQPGSSIMPGKVNPVLCESVVQVACEVVGLDAAVAACATGGVGSILELNVATPVIAWNLLTQIDLLANVSHVFADRCVAGIEANCGRCEQLIEQSLAMVTALAPEIGYDAAADIAKQAHATGKTIREICLEKDVVPADKLDKLLDARRQTGE
ncbi:MAG: class II fumarate hydratase [Planctomycetota bacterium]